MDVHRKIQAAIGKYDELLTLVKKGFSYISRSSDVAKMILKGIVKGKRRKDRQKRREEYIKEWTWMDFASSTRAPEHRTRWKGIVVKSFVVPQRPPKAMG